jgi:malate dehydrogenase
VKSVTENIVKYSPDAIIVIVSNPLDVMTYCAFLAAKVDSKRVFGMAGILDTARYRAFIASELNCSPKDIQAVLMGGHGDTMVPLPRYTTVGGIPVTELISEEKLNAIVDRTKTGGGEIVNLLGTSAWYAPGAAAAQMVEAIVRDQKRIFPVCALLNGEYGMKDIYLGVPVKLGKNGIEEIIELKLNDSEKALLASSATSVKEVMGVLDSMNLF